MRTSAVSIGAVIAVAAVGCAQEEPDKTTAVPPAASKSAAAPAAQTEEAVKRAVKEFTSAYASGDYAGAWEWWDSAAKKVLPQAEYEKVFELCPSPAQGVPFTVEAARLSAARDSAVVRVSRATFQFSYRVVYEGGQWRFKPDAQSLAEYRLGSAEKIAAKRRAAGKCDKTG
ncbi:hypothetical protein [Actinomadura miaoliensis]|uniref:Lipoprotein n=1 Tax=Actinomadura miaoliensis TaxID=430685 RepID=A0ABP7VMF2_9ACTN